MPTNGGFYDEDNKKEDEFLSNLELKRKKAAEKKAKLEKVMEPQKDARTKDVQRDLVEQDADTAWISEDTGKGYWGNRPKIKQGESIEEREWKLQAKLAFENEAKRKADLEYQRTHTTTPEQHEAVMRNRREQEAQRVQAKEDEKKMQEAFNKRLREDPKFAEAWHDAYNKNWYRAKYLFEAMPQDDLTKRALDQIRMYGYVD